MTSVHEGFPCFSSVSLRRKTLLGTTEAHWLIVEKFGEKVIALPFECLFFFPSTVIASATATYSPRGWDEISLHHLLFWKNQMGHFLGVQSPLMFCINHIHSDYIDDWRDSSSSHMIPSLKYPEIIIDREMKTAASIQTVAPTVDG